MTLKSLKGLKDKPKVTTSMAHYESLIKGIQHWMDDWPSQPGAVDVLRASGLHYLCPREFVLNYWKPGFIKSFDWKSYLLMEVGTNLHFYFQNYVLGPMGILKGEWRTIDKKQRKENSFHPDPERALWEVQHQKSLTWVYKEKRVWNGHLRIAGHIDGEVCINKLSWLHENFRKFRDDAVRQSLKMYEVKDEKLALLEIKTTGKYVFENLASPRDIADYYKMQAIAYQHLSGTRKTLFWYIQRENMDSEIMPFNYDAKWWAVIKKKAEVIWAAIRDETLPDFMMACKLPTDKRAKACAHKEPCWKRKLDMKKYITEAKESQPERKWLDLSNWKKEGE